MRGRRRCLLENHADWLLELIERRADLTLEDIRAQLNERGVRVSLWTTWSFFNRRNISLKKKKRRRA